VAFERDLIRLGAPERPVAGGSLEVMKAETAAKPFSRPGWLFELKLDGYRLLAEKSAGGVHLWTRNGKELTASFPEIVRAVAALAPASCLLDGELVVQDEAGRPDFQALQRRARFTRAPPSSAAVVLYAFDLLACEGYDLRPLPIESRKELLARVVDDTDPRLRRVTTIPEQGEEVYRAAVELELEGVVAKRAGSPYRAGYSDDWLKIRVDRVGDFAVVGYEKMGDGVRTLHLAVRAADGFAYAGRAGSGLTHRLAAEILERLEPARRPTPPAGGAPSRRGIVWVEPELVAEVRYKEWTDGAHLRHPVFLRLRDDKSPAECTLREARVDPGTPPPEAPPAPTRGRARPKSSATRPAAALPSIPEKVFWREEGYTKGDLFAYYRDIHPWLAPYLADRPLVVDRYPDGIAGKSFFQKSAPSRLSGVETVTLTDDGRAQEYFLCRERDCLLALVNLGAIPLHVTAASATVPDRPDWCILDLDPKAAPFTDVVRIALALRELCESLGLSSFVKTSGGSGLHVLLPLGRFLPAGLARHLAELLAGLVVARLPEIATTARTLAARRGRVYVDALQNGRGKLLAAPFSARPRPGATVSTPLQWSEVGPHLDPDAFTIRSVPERMEKSGKDPLLPILSIHPDLSAAFDKLEELLKAKP
jgi:bifunctional non-homologous end joining protein LigD